MPGLKGQAVYARGERARPLSFMMTTKSDSKKVTPALQPVSRTFTYASGMALLVIPTALYSQHSTESSDGAPMTADVRTLCFEYVGTKKCRMCHTDQYESLRRTAKAYAWDALKPGYGVAVRQRAGLDVSKDYTREPRCLACHSVGFGEPGGYVVPDPNDLASVRFAAAREGVGCESCHGPGSGFIEVMREIVRTDRRYHVAELQAVGRQSVSKAVCLRCHNETAVCMNPVDGQGRPTGPKYSFDTDSNDRTGYHDAFELKHRTHARVIARPPESKGKQVLGQATDQ